MQVKISKSSRSDKKLMATLDDGTIVHFGAKGYSDFTRHKDEDRKQRYINRHQRNENWNDPHTAGFWAKHLLWNKVTLEASARDIESKYKLKITLTTFTS